MKDSILKRYEQEPKRWGYQLAMAIIVLIIMLWSSSAVTFNTMTEGGLKITKEIVSGILHPDTELLFNFTTSGVAYLLLETVCIAFLGTIVGAILAIPLSFISASNLMPKPIAFIGRLFIMAVRTIPTAIYGLMFISVTGPGPFAGLLTMSVCSIGMISKLFIEFIEDLDTKILESLDAAGCTMFQKIRYGILPQLFPDFISTIIYRFDMNLRDATVLGLVAAGGIGSPLLFAMNTYKWNAVGAILVGLILLIFVVEFISTKIRVKLARG